MERIHTISDELEALPPEKNALLQIQANALQEERVLQPAEMLQVAVLPKFTVEILHAEGEVRAQRIDGAGVNACHVADA